MGIDQNKYNEMRPLIEAEIKKTNPNYVAPVNVADFQKLALDGRMGYFHNLIKNPTAAPAATTATTTTTTTTAANPTAANPNTNTVIGSSEVDKGGSVLGTASDVGKSA